MSMPLISIIINNYNYGRFLKEAIDSALNQTYKNVEVIVVDDGSTDDSKKVIKSFGDRIVPVYKENGGQGSAYNVGFTQSIGAFICNLDADDILFPQAIESAITLFEQQQVVKVQWPLLIVDKNGKSNGEITTKWTPPEGDLKDFVLNEGPFYDFYLHTGCLMKRSFLERVFPVPEKPYRNGADVYLVTLAPIFGEIRNIHEPLGTYRFHGANNYIGHKLSDERLANYIDRFNVNSEMLFRFASQLGLHADVELWKQKNNNYLWPTRLLLAKKDIEKSVPPGETYALINDDEWGEAEPVEGRKAIPFSNNNGCYDGLPADDEDALHKLKGLRQQGVGYLVIWWTSFWWRDHYKDFFQLLSTSFSCVFEGEHLLIYSIKEENQF